MSEYIRTNKFDTNECPNIFVKEKLIRTNVRIYIRDQYIRIFEYSNIFVTLWSNPIHLVCVAVLPPYEIIIPFSKFNQVFCARCSRKVIFLEKTCFSMENACVGDTGEEDTLQQMLIGPEVFSQSIWIKWQVESWNGNNREQRRKMYSINVARIANAVPITLYSRVPLNVETASRKQKWQQQRTR